MARTASNRQNVNVMQVAYTGGLNTISDPIDLAQDQAQALTNARLSTTFGAATKRNGCQRIGTSTLTTGATGNGGLYWDKAGASPMVLMQAQGRMWTTTTRDASATFTDRGLGMGGTYYAAFLDTGGAEVVYANTNTAGLYKTDGVTITAVAAAQACNGVVVYNNRLWGWNNATPGKSNGLYFSSLNNGETLGQVGSGGGEILVRTFGTSSIVRCAVVGSSLMIFHTAGVSRLTGFSQDDIAIAPQPVTSEVKTASSFAVCVVEQTAYVITAAGLYRVTEGGASIVGTVERPDPTVPVMQASIYSGSAWTYWHRLRREVWVGVPGTGVYTYSPILQSWSGPYTGTGWSLDSGGGIIAAAPIEVLDVNLNPMSWATPAIDGWVRWMDVDAYYKDDVTSTGAGGSTYATRVTGRRFTPAGPLIDKAIRYTNIAGSFAAGAAVTVETVTESGTDSQVQTTIAGETNYQLSSGGTGAWVEVSMVHAAASAAKFVAAGASGFVLGQR